MGSITSHRLGQELSPLLNTWLVLLVLAKDIPTHRILLDINCLARMSDDGGMR